MPETVCFSLDLDSAENIEVPTPKVTWSLDFSNQESFNKLVLQRGLD